MCSLRNDHAAPNTPPAICTVSALARMSELIRTSTRLTHIMSSLSGLDGNHATEDLGPPVRYHAANRPHPAFAANTL